jgi:hypothetical protein
MTDKARGEARIQLPQLSKNKTKHHLLQQNMAGQKDSSNATTEGVTTTHPTEDKLEGACQTIRVSIGSPDTGDEESEQFAVKETKALFWIRLFLFSVVLVSAVGVAVAVYAYTSGAESDEFEELFDHEATKIFETVERNLDLSLGAIDSFIVGVLSYAHATNATWPYVTIPDYAVRVAKLRAFSKAFVVGQFHFVRGDQREVWEEYSFAHDSWVTEAMTFQKKDRNFHGKLMSEYEPSGIHNNDGVAERRDSYLPLWQGGPVVPRWSPYNWVGPLRSDRLHGRIFENLLTTRCLLIALIMTNEGRYELPGSL